MGFRQSLHPLDTATGKDVSAPLVFGPDRRQALRPQRAVLRPGRPANPDGSTTVYASRGRQRSHRRRQRRPGRHDDATKTISLKPGDFPAGLALDGRGYLYVAVNENYGNGVITNITTPGSLAIIDTTPARKPDATVCRAGRHPNVPARPSRSRRPTSPCRSPRKRRQQSLRHQPARQRRVRAQLHEARQPAC